ncbi:HET domain-containing protein [Fusarium keratoplasticum]|uniref:HET domain-containing protein n=1 Tax=Fusarium keratoplasticum TaxID=1328300 RepID=A0ACC0QDT7_9HYPO|nr:HET domain-containing protein [Fusarium keratoplasticum]KAI8648186.1 HET domain-containing protein [Fusarium keratoplasticum]KAI8649045.1 HET domain-containing protein [Fusarium keratoplasticum]
MDTPQDQYHYMPLPRQGWFRLLTIEPAEASQVISCRLDHYEIDSSASYEAISYTWGDEKSTKSMLVNGKPFHLRPNLFSAFQAMRNANTPRTIWVDAICINQGDISERNNQVRQMNDIYSKAEVVNVWLGESTESSDIGIDFLKKFHSLMFQDRKERMPIVGSTLEPGAKSSAYPRSIESYSEVYEPILSHDCLVSGLDHAVALLSRLWWKRMWTLQESVLCPRVLCWCGTETFPIHYLYDLSYFIYFSVNFNCWKGSAIDPEVSLRAVWRAADLSQRLKTRRGIRVALALDSTWNRAASDPKDKVIGLLGLVGRRPDLEPDYSWPVEKVYRVAMRAALVEDGNLDCLGLISEDRQSRNEKLNSWVPDFGAHNEPFSDYITSLTKPIFSPRPYDASLRDNFSPSIRTENDDSTLVLKGLVVDSVQKVGEKAPGWKGQDSSKWADTMRSVLGRWRSLLPGAGYYPTGEEYHQSFWRTVLVDLKQGEHPNPSSAIGPQRLDDLEKQELIRLDTSEGLENLLNTWAACIQIEYRQLRLIEQFNRRFFITATGYFGLGPTELEPDDAICILLGGGVAYALRENGDSWRYIGECYVHGIMDGEIIQAMTVKSFREFRIV